MPRIGLLEDDREHRYPEMARTLASLRPAPELVHHDNAPDFLAWLGQALPGVDLLSLDHDLGPTRPDGRGGRFDPLTGMAVVDFLVTRPPRCPVIVHSSNPQASPEMVRRLEQAGWAVQRVAPFGATEWIDTAWARAVVGYLTPGPSRGGRGAGP